MEGPERAQALLIEDGRVRAAGALEDVEPLASGARRVNLEGKALLPAFVDGHSHVTALAQTLGLCQLSGCRNLGEIAQRMRNFRQRWHIPAGEWVIGFGYDQNDLEEGRHPTAADLDAALPDCPAMVTHASGHMGAVNSLGLQRLGVGKSTPDPRGPLLAAGRTALPTATWRKRPLPTWAPASPGDRRASLKILERAQRVYFSQGITTIHEGLARQPEWDLLEAAAARGLLRGDVAAYVDIKDSAAL